MRNDRPVLSSFCIGDVDFPASRTPWLVWGSGRQGRTVVLETLPGSPWRRPGRV